eukprot:4865463-Pyramimonas_sp.AAC.1
MVNVPHIRCRKYFFAHGRPAHTSNPAMGSAMGQVGTSQFFPPGISSPASCDWSPLVALGVLSAHGSQSARSVAAAVGTRVTAFSARSTFRVWLMIETFSCPTHIRVALRLFGTVGRRYRACSSIKRDAARQERCIPVVVNPGMMKSG